MRCSLLLGGLDRPYMDQLVRYMTMITRYSFDITYLETIEECMTYKAMNQIHIVVLERRFLEAMPGYDGFGTLPMMVIEEAMVDLELEGRRIFKYQSASKIAAMIHECFLEETRYDSVQNQSTRTRLIGCFSPMGGSGNTTISMMIAIAKRLTGKRVLYVSLDLAMVYEEVFESEQRYNFSDYCTYLMTNDNWVVGLERMRSVDVYTGVEYLKTANHMQDLLDFQKDYLMDWLTSIREYADYDYIVIDLSREDILDQLKCLEFCDLKVMVTRTDVVGVSKWRRFVKDIELSNKAQLIAGAIKIGNATVKGESQSVEGLEVELSRDDALVKEASTGWRLNQNSDSFRKIEVLANGL